MHSLRRGRLAILRGGLSGQLEARGGLLRLPSRPGGAGRRRLATLDGRPIAAQLWLVENGTAWIHKLAYAEDAKGLSPGTLLSLAMFRHAIDEDHVARIDYGTGNEAYKAEWMDEAIPLWRITAFNPRTLDGLAGAARASAGSLAARWRSR